MSVILYDCALLKPCARPRPVDYNLNIDSDYQILGAHEILTIRCMYLPM